MIHPYYIDTIYEIFRVMSLGRRVTKLIPLMKDSEPNISQMIQTNIETKEMNGEALHTLFHKIVYFLN